MNVFADKLQEYLSNKRKELLATKKLTKTTVSTNGEDVQLHEDNRETVMQQPTPRLDFSTSMVLKQIEQFQLEKRKKSKAFKEEIRDNYKK